MNGRQQQLKWMKCGVMSEVKRGNGQQADAIKQNKNHNIQASERKEFQIKN